MIWCWRSDGVACRILGECKFLGNLPRGGGGVSGAFGVVLGCESGGIAADESGV